MIRRRTRHDRASSPRADLPAPRVGRSGARTVTARIARVHRPGDPLVYPWGEEFRTDGELRSIVAQLPGTTVVAPHPTPAEPHFGLLRAGAPANRVGRIARRAWIATEPKSGLPHAYADIEFDSAANFDDDWDELSLGYTSAVDSRGYQYGTTVDHVAIVPRGRCGETCNLRADAALTAEQRGKLKSQSFAVPESEGLPMNDPEHLRGAMARFNQFQFKDPAQRRAAYHRILARAKEFGVDATGFIKRYGAQMDAPGGAEACHCGGACHTRTCNAAASGTSSKDEKMDPQETIRSLNAQLADAAAARDTEKARADSEKLRADTAEGKLIEAERDKSSLRVQLDAQATAAETAAVKRERERADAAELKVAKFDEKFEERVQARAELERKAGIVMGADYTMKGVPDREIMATVVKRLDAQADVGDGVEIGVITGRFLAATDRFAAGARALADLAEATVAADAGVVRTDRQAERMKRNRAPLPNSREYGKSKD